MQIREGDGRRDDFTTAKRWDCPPRPPPPVELSLKQATGIPNGIKKRHLPIMVDFPIPSKCIGLLCLLIVT